MEIKQRPAFKKVYKKLHKNQLEKVDDTIRAIVNDPLLGEEKRGDLTSVFVYKFDCINQQFLLAYQWSEEYRLLLLVGVHKIFYKKLNH